MIEALSAIEDLGEGHTWFKLAFDITHVERTQHVLTFKALASSPLGEVGFDVRFPLYGWDNRPLADVVSVDWGRIVVCSAGKPTDTLLSLLEQQFGFPVSGTTAMPELSCAAALLGDDPDEIETEEMHAKLFFDALSERDPDSYAEMYLNFDIKGRRAYLLEKDSGYRAPVVGWLSGRFRPAAERLH